MWCPSLASLSFPSSLAEIPITPDQVQQLIFVIGAAVVVGALGSIKAVLDIIRFFRSDPPASQVFASKEDLEKAMAEITAVEARTAKSLADLKDTAARERSESRTTLKEIFDRMDAMNRSLGRIEGTLAQK